MSPSRMGSAPDSLIVYLHADSSEQLLLLAHRVDRQMSNPAARDAGVASTFGIATLLPDPAVVPGRVEQVGPEFAQRVLADFDAVVSESSFSAEAYAPYAKFLRQLLTQTTAPGVAELMKYKQVAEALLPRPGVSSNVPTEAMTLIFLKDAMEGRASREERVAALRGLLRDEPGATLTGMSVLAIDTETTIHRDLPRLIAAAVIIIAVYLLIHFRSVTDALLAVVPTLCSLACLMFLAKLAGAKMNLANIVSIPLLIGIDVDYGIFLVSVARRSKGRPEMLEKVAASSQAVVLCATATLLGFGSLIFTSVPAIRSLGWAVGIGVVACAVSSLFFLLPLLLTLRGRAVRKLGAGAAALLAACFVGRMLGARSTAFVSTACRAADEGSGMV